MPSQHPIKYKPTWNSFNENSRVKIPALLHLTRLGYKYFSLKDTAFDFDAETNIIKNVFCEQFLKLNAALAPIANDFEKEFQNISLELGSDDLGKQFYKRLLGQGISNYKLLDWGNFNNNTFHICTELTCKNGEDEFRPDITVFVNGLPLAFIEVKKPNNPEGIKAERDRINYRFKNTKFRKFINITQLLVFSNNMEYDDASIDQLQGAFYATTSKNSARFNNFREELKRELVDEIKPIDEETENFVLKDNNLITLKHSSEFITNKNENTPTNRILSSLFTKHRLKTLLQYGIAYCEETTKTGEIDLQKHIMRYPQLFATKAIERKLNEAQAGSASGFKGVIWHTQGSGKTALAFYNYRYLTDYFSKKGVVPKFYFIVDRLDLLTQATKEFKKRGLAVSTVNSKDELINEFKKNTTNEGITVINIQKFNEDTTAFNSSGYDVNVQRIFFIDEAHRSYDPKGSSLANLYNSDKKSIKIALTGTPLIMYKERQNDGEMEDLFGKADLKTTRNIFGDYIHKYYYNSSIKDGYTLKLLREEIETSYKEKVRKIIKDVENEIKVRLGILNKRELYAHEKFCEPMLDYILDDFQNSRIRFGDKTIGAMVVCDSSEQARRMFELFNKKEFFNPLEIGQATNSQEYSIAAEPPTLYAVKNPFSAALILHDENDKEIRRQQIQDFKDGKIDFLFVYAMLLTGFDAPRLKKMYLGRKIKAHNLLQTLTRVNRPYKDFRMGYVVDFADISEEFDVTNRAYFKELNREYDTDTTGEDGNDVFGSLFMSKEEIDEKFQQIERVLSDYSAEAGDNKEIFSQQIQAIDDRRKLLELKNALEDARDIYNISRLVGHTEILETLDVKHISQLLTEVSNRLQLLNLKEAISDVNSRELLNEAIENVIFDFTKIGEEELQMAGNELQDIAHKTRQELNNNFNQKDQEWVLLYEEFKELLRKHNIDENNSLDLEKMKVENAELSSIYKKILELNRKNSVLQAKFGGDRKFARTYKIIESSGEVSKNIPLYNILKAIKQEIDAQVFVNENILQNQPYFEDFVGQKIVEIWQKPDYQQAINAEVVDKLVDYISREYFEEYENAA
ncbi:type I restriction-modification system endonuclease [Bacteroidia bacterium]|nr:type I restriction-modification system endonuclease [Bacteroidia bacterium]